MQCLDTHHPRHFRNSYQIFCTLNSELDDGNFISDAGCFSLDYTEYTVKIKRFEFTLLINHILHLYGTAHSLLFNITLLLSISSYHKMTFLYLFFFQFNIKNLLRCNFKVFGCDTFSEREGK